MKITVTAFLTCLFLASGHWAFAQTTQAHGLNWMHEGEDEPIIVQRGAKTYDPNHYGKLRIGVPMAERDSLGLALHTWKGVVDPQVYTRLEQLGKEAERFPQDFDGVSPVKFRGMVYVEVEVKTKGDSHAVLKSLTAAEFHVRQIFSQHAGFIGYASKEALDKLGQSPKVVGVCLDTKPIPIGEPRVRRKDLVSVKTETATQPGVASGKVDANLYRALAIRDRVLMIG